MRLLGETTEMASAHTPSTRGKAARQQPRPAVWGSSQHCETYSSNTRPSVLLSEITQSKTLPMLCSNTANGTTAVVTGSKFWAAVLPWHDVTRPESSAREPAAHAGS